MYDVSLVIPAIRTHLWERMYGSIEKSCKEHSFELILISPFDLPPALEDRDNIKLIKDYGCPTRAAQIGSLHCESKLLYHCVDDAIFRPNAIDIAIDFYNNNCSYKDAVNMRYREGCDYAGDELALSYWRAHTHGDLRLRGIDPEWKISLHHLLDLEYFREIGGWDCQFEYLNHALHDIMFRIQADGGKVFNSPIEITSCDWMPGESGDHAPIHNAQIFHDEPLFRRMYGVPGIAKSRTKIDINNWKKADEVWNRRFGEKLPESYESLMENQQ